MPNETQGNDAIQGVAAHTPGPWRADDYGMIWAEGDSMHVAQMRGWGRLTGTGGGLGLTECEAVAIQDANARLIAAAPDMLEALRAVDERGLYEYPSGPDDPYTEMDMRPGALEMWKTVRAAIAKAEGRATTPDKEEDRA